MEYINAEPSSAGFGKSVSGAGDVDADGYPDFIVGAPGTPVNGITQAGVAFLYSGKTMELLKPIYGRYAFQAMGSIMAAAGDVNADGHADVIFGAPNLSVNGITSSGSTFIYSGKDGSIIWTLNGDSTGLKLGRDVSTAGDVNADGYDDVILGSRSKYAYVYSGATGTLLYRVTGEFRHQAANVAGGGDVNGDGYDDIAIADSNGLSDSSETPDGVAYVFSGLDGSQLYRFDDRNSSDEYFGESIDFVGDANADGYADIIIGANGDQDGFGGGLIQIRSGKTGAILKRITGEDKHQSFGVSVSAAGDWDGDGHDDFAVGSSYYWSNYPGIVELFSGRTGSKLSRLNPPGDYGLGYSMDFLGDINGDGYPNCIVAMPARIADGVRGSAGILGLGPLLTLTNERVSIFNGGKVGMKLEFPPQAAHLHYKILMSAHGTGPTHHGIDIPLTLDAVMQRSAAGVYPVQDHVNMHGTFGSGSDARAQMTFPSDIPVTMLGTNLWVAAVAHPDGELPTIASVARMITLVLY